MKQPATGGFLLLSNEIQLLLAEERTALSLLRTGIGVFALPLSVLGLLIATSGSYRFREEVLLLLPLLVLSAVLVMLGTYLAIRGLREMQRCSRRLHELKAHNQTAAQLLDGAGAAHSLLS
ncbi:hypothetical protein GM658_10890 [Pseudoduganella eburnea]|uniref:DUF202 domain-containing protein n=1 Tax=Massilia eburnea TaxID=1776165 RepID=A0A6L6QFW2_9BURK|nr:hypothetical protein [Massilia eburnea]MTW11109.1 hypothetical protein [Massilia eburnea]